MQNDNVKQDFSESSFAMKNAHRQPKRRKND